MNNETSPVDNSPLPPQPAAPEEKTMNPPAVFEAVDVTSEEEYWTLGVWGTLAEALAELEACATPDDLGCSDRIEDEEHCEVDVRERRLGWGGTGRRRATLVWHATYDEAADEFKWERRPTRLVEDRR